MPAALRWLISGHLMVWRLVEIHFINVHGVRQVQEMRLRFNYKNIQELVRLRAVRAEPFVRQQVQVVLFPSHLQLM